MLALALPLLGTRRVAILDPQHEVRLLRGPGALTLAGTPGDLVSLIPLSETADGIDTAGLRYPLRDGTLHLGPTRGVSNERAAPRPPSACAQGCCWWCSAPPRPPSRPSPPRASGRPPTHRRV